MIDKIIGLHQLLWGYSTYQPKKLECVWEYLVYFDWLQYVKEKAQNMVIMNENIDQIFKDCDIPNKEEQHSQELLSSYYNLW